MLVQCLTRKTQIHTTQTETHRQTDRKADNSDRQANQQKDSQTENNQTEKNRQTIRQTQTNRNDTVNLAPCIPKLPLEYKCCVVGYNVGPKQLDWFRSLSGQALQHGIYASHGHDSPSGDFRAGCRGFQSEQLVQHLVDCPLGLVVVTHTVLQGESNPLAGIRNRSGAVGVW